MSRVVMMCIVLSINVFIIMAIQYNRGCSCDGMGIW